MLCAAGWENAAHVPNTGRLGPIIKGYEPHARRPSRCSRNQPGLLNPQTFAVVAGALHKVASRMEDVRSKQCEAAKLVRLGRMDEAFPIMSACLGIWQEVQTSLTTAADAVGQPVERLAELVLTPAGQPGRGPLVELATSLHRVKQTVQTRDWVGLADALEYDLDDLAQRWRAALLQPDEAEGTPSAGVPEFSRSAPAA